MNDAQKAFCEQYKKKPKTMMSNVVYRAKIAREIFAHKRTTGLKGTDVLAVLGSHGVIILWEDGHKNSVIMEDLEIIEEVK